MRRKIRRLPRKQEGQRALTAVRAEYPLNPHVVSTFNLEPTHRQVGSTPSVRHHCFRKEHATRLLEQAGMK